MLCKLSYINSSYHVISFSATTLIAEHYIFYPILFVDTELLVIVEFNILLSCVSVCLCLSVSVPG